MPALPLIVKVPSEWNWFGPQRSIDKSKFVKKLILFPIKIEKLTVKFEVPKIVRGLLN